MDPKNSADEFFASLPKEADANPEFKFFDDKKQEDAIAKEEVKIEEKPKEGENVIERKKPTRSERREERETVRLSQQLGEERIARARLEERLSAIEKSKDVPVDPDIQKMLTVNDPKEASRLFSELVRKIRQEAEDAAAAKLSQLSQREQQEVVEMASAYNDAVDAVSDAYGVDLDKATHDAFLDYVHNMLPDDYDGVPSARFMNNAWEMFATSRKAAPTNVKEKQAISARSMTKPTNSNSRPPQSELKPVTFETIRSALWNKLAGT